ncbi:hypothetical protein, partial [Pantoea ananatis]|uniref:hypothetical protein n=1 Tax=Pantoea ananas TaxID=553 RepID=UPI001B314B4C
TATDELFNASRARNFILDRFYKTEVLMKQTPSPPHLHNGKLLTFYRRKNDADWLCQGVNK